MSHKYKPGDHVLYFGTKSEPSNAYYVIESINEDYYKLYNVKRDLTGRDSIHYIMFDKNSRLFTKLDKVLA